MVYALILKRNKRVGDLMDLLTFISQESPSALGHVFCFIAKQNSLLINKVFKKKLETVSTAMTVLSSLESPSALRAHLDMSFLGEVSVFWLNEDILSENPSIYSYLYSYTGPNIVGYLNKTDSAQGKHHTVVIEVPDEVNYELFTQLFAFLYPTQSIKTTPIIKQIFKIYSLVAVDSVLLIMYYCILVGNKSDAFLNGWLPTLLNPEKSLFMLSALLFSKKEERFFKLWTLISSDYSDPFWTTYWSEQLFKATLFTSLMHAKNYAQAKRIAYRLPFSFVQKDWKLVTVEELKRAHDHLYEIDWNIKNGLHAHFEHFYLQFMLI